MVKAEIAEIKRLLKKDSNVITKIAGCYVDAQKEIKLQWKGPFYNLPEEESFKYEDILRKTLGGTPGRQLLNMDFTISEEEKGSPHHFLMRLRDSNLEDSVLLKEFYDKLIEEYPYSGNYYIIVIDMLYDVPGRTKDKIAMEDASEEVYHALLCSICPVELSKPGLSYNEEKRSMEHRIRDWVVGTPMNGFLFPVFNDRTTDIHSVLYYAKKIEGIKKNFLESFFGITPPLSGEEEKELIQEELQNALQENCDYKIISNIHEEILQIIEENEGKPEPLLLGKEDIVKIMENSGADEEAIKKYEKSEAADIEVMAENILDKKKIELRTSGIHIKADPAYMQRIKTMDVEGRRCIVIEIDEGVDINGIHVKA